MAKAQVYCEKCHKTMSEDNFYTLKDGTKAPLCKKCLTMHIDNFDEETYLWVLQMLDLPYVPIEWNKIRKKAWEKDGAEKMNGMSVLGKYISLMKLKQWRIYGWDDTERIAAKQEEEERAYIEQHPEKLIEAEELQKKYEAGEISEAQYKTLMRSEEPEKPEEDPNYLSALYAGANGNGFDLYGVPEGQTFMQPSEIPDPSADLTQEDKIYLVMKWGREWQPNDWISLEKVYNEYLDSFDVTEVDTRNNILLICKAYVKMNQALNTGDYDAFTKLNRAYESLRKTAKLTAQQNKDEKDNFVDCIGNMVVICEKEGFIPRFATDQPNDLIDKIIQDMNNFTRTFAEDNLNLSNTIDMYLKRIEIQKQLEDKDDNEFTDDDLVAYYEQQEEDAAKDLIEAESDF